MINDETLFQSDDQQSQAQQASRHGVPALEGYQLQQKLGSGAFARSGEEPKTAPARGWP